MYESHIERYKEIGLNGKPMDFNSYRNGFYKPQFEDNNKKSKK